MDGNELWRRILWIAGGLLLLAWGARVRFWGAYAWGDVRIPANVAWLVWGMGLVAVGYGVFASSTSVNWKDRPASICPKCQTPYPPDWKGNATCPKCGVSLEPITGYYDRHPELRDPAPQDDSKPHN